MAWLDKYRKEKERDKPKQAEQDSTEEQKLVSLVQNKYRTAYDAKAKYHALWKTCEDAYTGDLFKRNLPEYKADELSNFVFSTIEAVKPIMLSNYPKAVVVPAVPSGFEKSQLVQNSLDYEWRRMRMFEKLLGASHFALVYGTVCFGVFWNGSLNKGLGETDTKVISPFNIFPDPSATHEDNANYIAYAAYKQSGELCEAYPEKAEEIKAQITNNIDENLMYGADTNSNTSSSVLYIEMYIRDYAVETEIEDELDESGAKTGRKLKVTKRKYPNGRRVIIAGDVLLEDGQNPYKDGKFPFRFYRCYPMPNRFWGIGEVENLISPQKHIGETMNSIIESAGLMGNPIWILDKNSGVEKNSLTNRKGLVIRKNPGTEVRREAPPPLPAYIKDIVSTLEDHMEKVSGVYDVMRGERPAGITAAAAINALNEQAQGRVKLKVQLMETVIADLGSMQISRMQQFWETTRTIRISGGKYQADELTNAQMFQINGRNYMYQDVSKDDIDGDYDIEIVAGSTMQQNKTARLQQLIQLAQTPAEDGMPMVDRKTILENSDLENIQEIVNYFGQMQQSQQEAQQQQLQAQQDQMMQAEQMKAEQEMQMKTVDRQMDKESKEEDMMIEEVKARNDHERNKELSKEQSEQEPNKDKSLQKGQDGLEYNGEEEMLKEVLAMLSEMPQEEVQALAQENPQIAQLLQILSQMERGI